MASAPDKIELTNTTNQRPLTTTTQLHYYHNIQQENSLPIVANTNTKVSHCS